jgi:hypothetical protein
LGHNVVLNSCTRRSRSIKGSFRVPSAWHRRKRQMILCQAGASNEGWVDLQSIENTNHNHHTVIGQINESVK